MRRLLPLLAIIAATASPIPAVAGPGLSQVRSADGVNLLVAQAGDPRSPGILFVHGFAQSYLSFRRQFEQDLAKDFHVVAFDLRGHGGSSKPDEPAAYTDIARSADDLAAVIRATGLKRPLIVGWSYGGIVVGDYVRKYGTANISGIVFAGTLGGLAQLAPPARPNLAAAASAMRSAAEKSRAMDLGANVEGGRIISDAYATPSMTAEDRQLLFGTEMMLPAYARRYMLKRPMDNSDLVGRLAALPIMLIRGERELGMPEEGIAALAGRLPRLTVLRFPGAGHLTFFEQPERFNRELARFALAAGTAPVLRGDPAATIARPGFPLPLAAHRRFRDREFAVMDRNKDGRIDMAELRERMEAATGQSSPEALARAMRVNCGSERQSCTRAAFRRQGDSEFVRVDGDHDGSVTQAEFGAAGSTFHTERPY